MANEIKCNVNRRHRVNCNPGESSKPKKVYPPFSTCIFSGNLVWDGEGLSFTKRSDKILDGSYTQVNVINGCVSSLSQAPIEGYTPSDCCGMPGGASSGNSAAHVVVSPAADNLLQSRPDGLYTRTYLQSSDNNLTISGNGTSETPFNIKLGDVGFNGIYIHGLNGVKVTGNGTQEHQINIELDTVGVHAGSYNGFTIDAYGRVISVDEEAVSVNSIVATAPLKSDITSSGVCTLSLDFDSLPTTTYKLGRYTVVVTSAGTVKSVSADAGIPAGSFVVPACTLADGTSYPAKKITYNEEGIIVSAEEVTLKS